MLWHVANAVADAVAKVGPAVVRIDTRRQVVSPMGMFGGGPPVQHAESLCLLHDDC